ncbi:cytochrome P450 [Nocardia sp. NPDC050697]|uniref:cytochrome P450 n=1 Tax=Nocardia sp. NPDC050697 TaxID=3155158 RepID=UPI0033EE8976
MELFSRAFAADPHSAYRHMREQFGPVVPVWLAPQVPGTLVVGYREALAVLHDPERFPADPSRWERTAQRDSEVYPVLAPRQNALRSAGPAHARFREAITASLAGVDLYSVERAVDRAAEALIHRFCQRGSAELRGEYAFPLTVRVMCELLGIESEVAEQVWLEMARMLDGDGQAGARFGAALYAVARDKRTRPGLDMMSRLVEHPAGLNDAEVVDQTALLLGPGTEPTCNLITNTVLMMLSDERFAAGLLGGGLSIRDAIEEVLAKDTPLPNFCISYPRQPRQLAGVWLPADEPVVISMAACNSDPAAAAHDPDGWGNRAHLSWGAGPHACPAQAVAGVIVARAIEQLLDALPELELAPGHAPSWRPGPFHRAIAELQVRFPATDIGELAMPPLRPREGAAR